MANYPSSLLYNFFSSFNDDLFNFFCFFGEGVSSCLVYGVYRILTWTVSVMLPPMAIFFPLFALLEKSGYLPRVAFNLDNVFQKCGSCGRQALTMMMGFGCNAVGVTESRYIDSEREKLISILTNSLVPCNGRFPILTSVITMFMFSGAIGSLILTMFIVLSVLFTFFLSKFLSSTILKGNSSSFSLELPPYRRPRVLKIIVNSFFSKTIFVLRRAVFVSIPFGFIIYLVSNIYIGGESILSICASFLDPFGRFIGLDGVILMAFILGFPANEIVIPIMIMGYMSLGYIEDFSSLNSLKDLLVNNGWTFCTAICMIIFTLVHFPCFTTFLTIRKESSLKWALLSIFIPLVFGILLCFLISRIYYLIF